MDAPQRIYRVLAAILGEELSVTAFMLFLTTSLYYSTGVVRGNWMIFNEPCRKRQKVVAEATHLKAAATDSWNSFWALTPTHRRIVGEYVVQVAKETFKVSFIQKITL